MQRKQRAAEKKRYPSFEKITHLTNKLLKVPLRKYRHSSLVLTLKCEFYFWNLISRKKQKTYLIMLIAIKTMYFDPNT